MGQFKVGDRVRVNDRVGYSDYEDPCSEAAEEAQREDKGRIGVVVDWDPKDFFFPYRDSDHHNPVAYDLEKPREYRLFYDDELDLVSD